jgi:hypothetical protein
MVPAFCASAVNPATEGDKAEVEQAVAALYASVTMAPGTSPDWDSVRTMFIPEAIIVMRTSRETMSVFDLDAWIQDFKDAIVKWEMNRRGFEERLLKTDILVFGDIAHCFAVYRASFLSGENLPSNIGLDSIELVRRDGRWLIVSITNEVELPGRTLPEHLCP